MRRGQLVTAVCNKCWSCRLVRANDHLGRAIAEARSADHIRTVTLTYSDAPQVHTKFNERIPEAQRSKRKSAVSEAFAAASIVKTHWQDYVKALRKDGVKYRVDKLSGETEEIVRWRVRYFAATEFSPRTQRVHFHAILYFYGPECPDFVLDRKIWGGDRYWPHGIVFYRAIKDISLGVKQIYYVAKYQLKSAKVDNKLVRNQNVNAQALQDQQWATRSDQPPLGTLYFQKRADEIAKQGLALRDLIYTFADVPRTRGRRGLQEFRLRFGSAAADAYIRAYLDAWERYFPGVHPAATDLVQRYEDRHAMGSAIRKQQRDERVALPHLQPDGSLRQPGDTLRASFDEKLHTWVGQHDGHRLLWSFDIDGNRGWSAHIVTPTEARRRRALLAAAGDAGAYRAASQTSVRSRRG